MCYVACYIWVYLSNFGGYMSNNKLSPSLDTIASVIGNTLQEVFGVVGLGNKKSLKDNINIFFKTESFKDGVAVKKENDKYIIDIYVILSYGVKISEVINNISSQVRFNLEKKFNIKIKSINIFIQDVKKI